MVFKDDIKPWIYETHGKIHITEVSLIACKGRNT